MKKFFMAVALFASAIVASPSIAAPVGFTGAYDYSTWATSTTNSSGGATNGGFSTISSDQQTLNLYEPDTGGGGAKGFNFAHEMLASGTLSFNWSFNGQADACCSGFNVYVNDTLINVANNSFNGSTYVGALLSGVFTRSVSAGDMFRFQQYSGDSCCGASFTTITNFDAPAVPEPAMLGLFGLGFLGVGVARRRRKRA